MRRWTLFLAGFLALVAAGHPGTGVHSSTPLTFTCTIIDSSPPNNPHCKTAGDIDGDGYIDVLVAGAGTSSQGLFWYRYPAWSKHAIVPPESAIPFTTDMQVGDVDDDGDLDVVIPKGYPNGFSVTWYENPRPLGDPALDAWTEHSIGDGAAHDLEVGDVSMNGRLDVVVRRDSTTLFLRGGSGAWTTSVISRRDGEGTALGDLDLDGDLDVAINGYWLENPLPLGDPAVLEWVEHVVDAAAPALAGVCVADVDGDGRNDVVLAPSETSTGTLSWYDTTDPVAGVWTQHVVDANVSYLHTFKVADMDVDGDLDVVAAEMEQSTDPDEVSVYRNEGAGLAWVQEVVATTGSHNIRVADIGRDGDLDIIGANWSGASAVALWENALDPTPTAATSPPLTALTLRQNVPNPFSGSTTIEFGLPRAGDIEVEVFDVAGRRVYSKHISNVLGGWNRVDFDGQSRGGDRLPTGIYFYRVRSAHTAVTRKMLILR